MRYPQEAFEHERPCEVFDALVERLPASEGPYWAKRWLAAQEAENTIRDYRRAEDYAFLSGHGEAAE